MTRHSETLLYLSRPAVHRQHDIDGLVASAERAIVASPAFAFLAEENDDPLGMDLVATVTAWFPDPAYPLGVGTRHIQGIPL